MEADKTLAALLSMRTTCLLLAGLMTPCAMRIIRQISSKAACVLYPVRAEVQMNPQSSSFASCLPLFISFCDSESPRGLTGSGELDSCPSAEMIEPRTASLSSSSWPSTITFSLSPNMYWLLSSLLIS